MTLRILTTLAVLLLGLSSAMAEMPAPNPAAAIAQAETNVFATADWFQQVRKAQKTLCRINSQCWEDFEHYAEAELRLSATVTEYRLAELHGNVQRMRELYDDWGKNQRSLESWQKITKKYYASTPGSP
jgi:hypothetical protein